MRIWALPVQLGSPPTSLLSFCFGVAVSVRELSLFLVNHSTQRRMWGLGLCGLAALTLACRSVEPEPEAAFVSLVEAERAFARSAATIGARDAFLAYLAEDAILFRPRATNGKKYLAAQPASAGLLAWEPVFADVSRAGDLGFTTGPWSYRPEPAADPIAHGQYFTVWKVQPDDTWKVVIDHGTYTPPPDGPPAHLERPNIDRSERRRPEREIDRATGMEQLLDRDRDFASATAMQGQSQAMEAFFTADVRILRNGVQPLTGIDAARGLASDRSGTLSWQPLGGDLARSGDLGYTYGEYAYEPSDTSLYKELGNYVRVWRNTTGTGRIWRVEIDLLVPLPRQAAED